MKITTDREKNKFWEKINFGILKNIDNRKIFTWLVVILMVTFYSVFLFYPLIYGMIGSFHDWNPLIGKFDFVGLKNYIRLFKDKLFLPSLLNTLYFTIAVTTARIIIALAVAAAINSLKKFKDFFRTMYFLPVVVSLFAASLVWKWMYNPLAGIFNQILKLFGLAGLKWLADADLALPSIMLMTLWKDMGYAIVIFLAGLTSIPRTYIEASQIDGASRIKTFWYITLPLLRPTMAFVLIISFISYIQIFIQIYVMTKGGPGYNSSTIIYMIYTKSFQNFQFGYGSAMAVILFLIIFILSIIQLRIMFTTWEY